MAYTTINKSSEHFNTKLYTGNGGTQSITGVGFQPDFTWLKGRSFADYHVVNDAVRGATKSIYPNDTASEGTQTNGLTSFDSDGFSIGNWSNINLNGGTLASWNWKANGSGSTNTVGSINSTVSVNTTSGFSIVKYTGTGNAETIGHGLGVSPACIIIKNTSDSGGVDWFVYHQSMGATKRLKLNQTVASSTSSFINNTAPSSTVFNTEGGGASGINGETYIAYCFAEKQGFSKFGSYTGNGSTDGPFCYTGFKPAFVIIKSSSAAGSWLLWDNKRSSSGGFNTNHYILVPNNNEVEQGGTNYSIDMISNGFKLRNNNGNVQNTGENMVYMAFAEAPLVGTNNVPATAR